MKKVYLLLLISIFSVKISYSQTTTIIGVMSVYSALGGAGCDASCDEGAYYASYAPYVFCNTGAAVGAAGATEQPMWISFNIPNACNVTVKGEYGAPYREHSVCSDSRMDGSDLLGIANTSVTNANISGGSVINVGTCNTISGSGSSGVVSSGCVGAANTDEEVTYSTSGPVTVSVYGHSNRSDEVITYTVTGAGSSCSTIGVIVLPIKLIGFAAYKATNNTVDLKWTTLTETNNNYFMVEYSLDATNFIPFAKVNGAGNSFEKKDYSCIFNHDVENNTFYFRLKQVDYNGNFTYSPIISAGTSTGFLVPTSPLTAYYDAHKEKIIAKFNLTYPQQISLVLYNVNGQEMYSSNSFLSEGNQEILIDAPYQENTLVLVYQTNRTLPIHKKIMILK